MTRPIADVQRRLKEEGFNSGAIDGVFGQHTKMALEGFQLRHRLPPTGTLTQATERLLFPLPPGIIGGILSVVFSKETGMGKYSKLIAALAGNVVGMGVAYGASKGLGTCTIPADPSTCTVLGMGTAQLTGVVLALVNSVFVFGAPKNSA